MKPRFSFMKGRRRLVPGVISANERVKKLNSEPLQDARPSFPRRRESISTVETTAHMGSRLRGYDAAAQDPVASGRPGNFLTRSNAGIYGSKKRRLYMLLSWVPGFAGTTLQRGFVPAILCAVALTGCGDRKSAETPPPVSVTESSTVSAVVPG